MATWNLDPSHSEVTFKVKHMMIANVTGKLGKFEVQAEANGDAFDNSKITFIADPSSISTGDEKRDGHLMTEDFFAVEKYPQIKFESTSFADGKLHGNLTIREITHPITLDVEAGGFGKDPWGNTRAGFTVTGKISRKDWNLTWNAALEAGGVLVSDEVKIACEIQLVKAA
jgi:polyisoprenoid-binding protein YceI